jgi:hypothetical protein
MPTEKFPKCAASLKQKCITEKCRRDAAIGDDLLMSNFESWSIHGFIEEYFLTHTIHNPNGRHLYNTIIAALETLRDHDDVPSTSKNYISKVRNFIGQKNVKLEFLKQYKDMERKTRLEESQKTLDQEVDITSNELVEENLANRSRKRRSGVRISLSAGFFNAINYVFV